MNFGFYTINLLLWLLVASALQAQQPADSVWIRSYTDTLAAPAMAGRGYVRNGLSQAARFIETTLNGYGLKVVRQPFTHPVNVFNGPVQLSLNGQVLKPGHDFLVSAGSPALKASGSLVQADSVTWVNPAHKVAVEWVDKLTWSVSTTQDAYTVFNVRKTALQAIPQHFEARVAAQWIPRFESENIMTTIPGTRLADSLVVFTAHYDHLGMMGPEALFAGANDNAAGAAMLLALAKYYRAHPAPYTIVFLFFAAEEAGLLGSRYFVDNALITLKHIRFLINLDLVGNGEEGITVVNATEFKQEFEWLQQLNEEYKALPAVLSRGKSANSDHYWFTEKGVPSFFLYTMGPRKAYHDVEDIAETVPHTKANALTQLLKAFVARLTNDQ
ncbi:MAG TPA: M20/M25/M40 family metallo-hydrolase [Phnomibacter sp.]|nr:M20/M25/M40 family metallo-hydrolase [Phnomibacter sp.]